MRKPRWPELELELPELMVEGRGAPWLNGAGRGEQTP